MAEKRSCAKHGAAEAVSIAGRKLRRTAAFDMRSKADTKTAWVLGNEFMRGLQGIAKKARLQECRTSCDQHLTRQLRYTVDSAFKSEWLCFPCGVAESPTRFGEEAAAISSRRPYQVLKKMNKLTVMLVDPPDDEAASVTLRSETGEVTAFCHPCDLKAGDVIGNRLAVLDSYVMATCLSDWPDDEKTALSTEWIEPTGHYSYKGRGRVINQVEGLVEVQGFIIKMDVPCEGYVDFNIRRLDIGT